MTRQKRTLESIAYPAVLVAWVVCGVVLVCQYKGMVPWLDQWPEGLILLVTFVPPLLLAVYVAGEVIKVVLK